MPDEEFKDIAHGGTEYPPRAGTLIGGAGTTNFGFDRDAAAYIIALGRFVWPRIYIPGKASFVFPLGTEGLRLFGSAALGIHKYIGDNAAVVEVMHRDERRI